MHDCVVASVGKGHARWRPRSEKTVTGISVPVSRSALGLRSGVLARDVWMGNDLGPMKTEAWNIAELASHDSVFLRFHVQN